LAVKYKLTEEIRDFSRSFLERKEPKELQKDEEIEKAKRP